MPINFISNSIISSTKLVSPSTTKCKLMKDIVLLFFCVSTKLLMWRILSNTSQEMNVPLDHVCNSLTRFEVQLSQHRPMPQPMISCQVVMSSRTNSSLYPRTIIWNLSMAQTHINNHWSFPNISLKKTIRYNTISLYCLRGHWPYLHWELTRNKMTITHIDWRIFLITTTTLSSWKISKILIELS
jgi:hypothetical protein